MSQAKDIITEKLARRLETGQAEGKPFIEAVERDGNLLNDFIMPLGNNNSLKFYNKGSELRMKLSNGEDKDFSLHDNAVYQTAEKLSIPASYLQSLNRSSQEWQAE